MAAALSDRYGAVRDAVWTAQGTNPDAIDDALRELLRARHAETPSLAPARVLNLIVIVDREWKGEVANRLERVGRYHASRTLLCAIEDGRTTLDATAIMTYDDTDAGVGIMHEHVEIDLGPNHLQRIDTIVDPVLVAELPTVLWSPHGHDEAVRTLEGRFDVQLLDSDAGFEPAVGLGQAASALETAYVVDLAWLRTTPWRERLAASFDPPERVVHLRDLAALEVRHRPDSAASALLLAGWLSSRLGWRPTRLKSGPDAMSGVARRGAEEVRLGLEARLQDVPGLVGITVSCSSGFSLSLDRADGGLLASERSPAGTQRVWHILGASRGEGGILGEGVRQALLRDWTYAPALGAAQEFCQR